MILFLLACPPAPSLCELAADQTPTVTVGTGTEVWEELADNDQINAVWGPQGGAHVYGSVRITGFVQESTKSLSDPNNIIVSMVMTEDGNRAGGYEGLPRIFESDGESLLLLGEQVIFDVAEPGAMNGRKVVLEASVEDMCGTTGTDSSSLTVLDS